jgi:hypothetical protein
VDDNSTPVTSRDTVEQRSPVLVIPEGAKIPDGATFYEGEDDRRCRLVRADGRRCGATRMRAYGLCATHAGMTPDISAMSAAGHAAKKRKAQARATLGISARRASTPLQAARVAAQMRANDYARAIVDEPLDADIDAVAKQRAAIAALELLYPQASLRVDVEMPADEEGVEALGWSEMQALAASLLD